MLNLLKRVINKSTQKQEAGNNSTNFQAQQVIVNKGVSYSDAKEIAHDVFMANFIELKKEAAVIAKERAEEVTDNFIEKLNERNPESINEFESPALQDALFKVQKQYAISGDEDLGDLLVDILVDRAGAPKRNMVQIVLDESLNIAPKLTIEQFDTLTLNFLLISTMRRDLKLYSDLINHFKKRVLPFVENLSEKYSDYTHAEFLGCGHVRTGSYGSLEQRLRDMYKAYFSNGFTKQELDDLMVEQVNLQGIVIPCLHDEDRLQIGVLDDEVLDKAADKNGISEEIKDKLKSLFESSTKPADVVKDMLIAEIPEFKNIFDAWENSPFDQFELTSVGIAIAHANYRRKIGETMDLSIWIK
ncbi:LPO_1073/Vpar_1526 family protein [Vibrio caribbeanicus]|uniref:LPO_1073/Vpar_1526 family protein n=1 Tax=Vibrio caribbeanicus TaxID=701175 RepID=UPI002284FF56|nr:LPO_1073/Vpar_1526 family protein [Vibrio caribbeanicus]MCY9843072.1 hypothetical protein [Vibrio caribbeanicus]